MHPRCTPNGPGDFFEVANLHVLTFNQFPSSGPDVLTFPFWKLVSLFLGLSKYGLYPNHAFLSFFLSVSKQIYFTFQSFLCRSISTCCPLFYRHHAVSLFCLTFFADPIYLFALLITGPLFVLILFIVGPSYLWSFIFLSCTQISFIFYLTRESLERWSKAGRESTAVPATSSSEPSTGK